MLSKSNIAWLWMVLALVGASAVQAQPKGPGEWAWKDLFMHEGLEFYYIFYSEADNVNNGVVILLVNTNDYPITYRFKVVFRAGEAQVVEEVEGSLDAGESRTGDEDGLFWIPFLDGRAISEVGLRGYKVTPLRKDGDTKISKGISSYCQQEWAVKRIYLSAFCLTYVRPKAVSPGQACPERHERSDCAKQNRRN